MRPKAEQCILILDNVTVDTVTVTGTGGWYTWATINSSINFPDTGIHILKLSFRGTSTPALFNVNWLDINTRSPVIIPRKGASFNFRMLQSRQGLHIDIPANMGIRNVEIYGANGSMIKKFSLPKGVSSVQTGKLRAGAYLVRLTGKNMITRPFVMVD